MNGLPLPQLSGASEITKIDPLNWINTDHKKQMDQLQQQFTVAHAEVTRDRDNKLRMLDREYKIERQNLEQRFRRLEPTEENMRRAQDAILQLNKKYQLADSRTRGKVEPDLQELVTAEKQAMQQLEMKQSERIREIELIRRLENQGIITDPAASLKAQYQVAGVSLPTTAFRQPDPTEEFVRLSMARMSAEERNDYRTAEAIDQRMNELMGGISPDVAEATKAATRLSGLEGRQKRRKAEKEGPGTLAEGVLEAKNRATKAVHTPFTGLAWQRPKTQPELGTGTVAKSERKPTAAELRKRGTVEAYEEGKRLGYWS